MADHVVRGEIREIPGFSLKQNLLKILENGSHRIVAIDSAKGHHYNDDDFIHGTIALATELRSRNCSRVGICLPVSFEAIIAIAACILAEVTYVHLDPSISIDMMKMIAAEAEFHVILTDAVTAGKTQEAGFEFIDVERYSGEEFDGNKNTLSFNDDQINSSSSNRITCIIYTSGSTGTPKGVKITESSILNRLHWGWQKFPYQEGDVASLKTQLSFVDSPFEILQPLLKRVPIVIIPKSILVDPQMLLTCLKQHHVTHIILVPSLLRVITEYMNLSRERFGPDMRILMSSGEELIPDLAEKLMLLLPDSAVIVNMYGATEASGDALTQTWTSIQDLRDYSYNGMMSIGSPIFNEIAFMENVDADGIGELVVAGSVVAAGYINDDVSSKMERFFQHPQYGWCYRMGDRVSVHKHPSTAEKYFVYHGRNDSLVKVNGQRVNLMQVTRLLASEYTIRPVVVFHEPSTRILAFVCHDDFVRIRGPDKMKRLLPHYAVPEIIDYGQDPMPTKPGSGKIDHQALLQFYSKLRRKTKEIRDNGDSWLSNHAEKEIGEQMREHLMILLQVIDEAAGITYHPNSKDDLVSDNFFRIGGTSLNAIAVVLALNRKGLPVSVQGFVSAASFMDLLLIMSGQKDEKQSNNNFLNGISFHPLTMDDADDVIHLIASTFCKHEILLLSLHQGDPLLQQQFILALRSFVYEVILKGIRSGLSFVARSGNSSERKSTIIAAYLATALSDHEDLVHCLTGPEHEPVLPIYNLLEYMEESCMEQLKAKFDRILYAEVMCIDTEKIRSQEQRAALMFEMENQLLVRAADHEYQAILTINTNPVTQDANAALGYESLKRCHLIEYQEHGTGSFPFKGARDGDHIALMMKTMK